MATEKQINYINELIEKNKKQILSVNGKTQFIGSFNNYRFNVAPIKWEQYAAMIVEKLEQINANSCNPDEIITILQNGEFSKL